MAVGISLEHLTKTFVKDKNEFRAVDDVHLCTVYQINDQG